jgi:putative chitinase
MDFSTTFNELASIFTSSPTPPPAVVVASPPASVLVAPLDKLPAVLRVVAPHLTAPLVDTWTAALAHPMQVAQMNTPKRVCAAIGQFAEESGGFSVMQENLNYSAARMMQVWPSRFPTLESAQPYANNPEKLADLVYSGRLGNGTPESGDGWRFRGEGLIELTGRALDTQFAQSVGMTVDQAAAWMLTPPGAAASACWYWTIRGGLNELADAWEISAITQKVNGGLTNLQTRLNYSNEALKCYA